MNGRVLRAAGFGAVALVAAVTTWWASRRFSYDLVQSIVGVLFCMVAVAVFVIDRWHRALPQSARWFATGALFQGISIILFSPTHTSMLALFLTVAGVSCMVVSLIHAIKFRKA